MTFTSAQFEKVGKTLTGEDIIHPDGKQMTLRAAIRTALVVSIPGEQATGDQKLKLFTLAQRVQSFDADINFSVEEVSTIKERVGKAWGVEVVGFVYNELDPQAS